MPGSEPRPARNLANPEFGPGGDEVVDHRSSTARHIAPGLASPTARRAVPPLVAARTRGTRISNRPPFVGTNWWKNPDGPRWTQRAGKLKGCLAGDGSGDAWARLSISPFLCVHRVSVFSVAVSTARSGLAFLPLRRQIVRPQELVLESALALLRNDEAVFFL